MHQHLSPELALKQFDADAAFGAALAEFQAEPAAGTIIAEARRAANFGLSWFCRPSGPGFIEVRLRHKAGAEISADGESITALLAGLLGHPLAHDIAVFAAAQTAEPEQEKITVSEIQVAAEKLASLVPAVVPASPPAPSPAQVAAESLAASTAVCDSPGPNGLSYTCDPAGDTLPHADLDATLSPAQVAAESLAAATGGVVVTEPSEYVPDPNELLTDSSRQACVNKIKAMNAEQRKSFTIAFRHAFRVPRDAKAITPLITEIRHWDFYLRWSGEASGGVAA